MEFPNSAQSRLGGLTLAVGLGLAVTSGQGVANAAPDSDDDTSSSESSTGPASPGSTPKSDASDTRRKTGLPTKGPRGPLSSVSASGGANTSTSTDRSERLERLERLKTPAKPRATRTSIRPSSQVSTSPGADTATSTDPSETIEPAAVTAPERTLVTDVVVDSGDSASGSTPKPLSLAPSKVNKLPSLTSTATPRRLITVSAETTARAEKLAAAQMFSAAVDTPVEQVTTPDPAPLTSAPAPAPIATIVAAPARVVSGLLSWVGFRPSAVSPHAPIAPTKLVELAWVALRRTFLNTTPTSTVVVGQPHSSGIITGSIVGADADGDPLAYSVIDAPERGTVTVDPTTGAFTYTPDAELAETGGAVSFRVAIRDQGLHLHGLQGLFTPGGGHVATTTVNLVVPPANEAPVSGTPPYTVDHSTIDHNTGAVRGTVNITDPDGNTLTYTVTQPDPDHGTVEVDSATGNWTFTPTGKSRLHATASGLPQTTQFTITASDGRESTSVTVTAPIDPAQVAVVDVIEVPGGPTVVGVTPGGSIILIGALPTLTVVNPDTTVTTIPIDFNPGTIWVDKPTETIYVTSTENVIFTLDAGTQTVIDTGIRLDEPVTGLTTTSGTLVVASGGTLHGYNGSEKLVVTGLPTDHEIKFVVDSEEDTVIATSTHAVSRLAVSLDLGEARMMGANSSAGGTLAFDEMGRIDFGEESTVTAVSYQDGRMVALVTTNGEDQLVLIDTYYGMEEMDRFAVGSGATGVVLNNDIAYITNATTGTVTVVDVYSQEVLATIHTGSTGGVAALPGGGAVVTNPGTVMTIGHAVPQD